MKDRGFTWSEARYWQNLLKVAFGEPSTRVLALWNYTPEHAASILRGWDESDAFHAWAQSLPPEDAAKLFALLSAPEVPTDTSSGSGSP